MARLRTTADIGRLPARRPPTHPGEMLLEEFLRPMGVSQNAAARRLKISTNRLNELIRGKRGMTADTAIRLSRWLGTTPQFWMHLQVAWDLSRALRNRTGRVRSAAGPDARRP